MISSVTDPQPTSHSAVTLTHNMSKTKAQTDQNTPHMKNIHKNKEHTPRKLIQIKLSNINHRFIKIHPEFSQGVVDTD